MSRKKEMAKNAIILIIGKLCTQFMNFLLLPLYTSYLSTIEYGNIDLVATYAMFLMPVVFLQLDQAVFRFLINVRNDEEGKRKVITSSIYFTIALSVIVSLVFLCFQGLIGFLYKWHVVVMVLSMGLSNLMLQVARGHGDNVGYAMASALSAGVQIILNVLFIVVFGYGVESVLSATIAANIAVFVFLFMREKTFSCIKMQSFSKLELKEMLMYAIPYVPNALIWGVMQASDRMMVSCFINVSANGLVAVGHKFPSVFNTFFALFNLSWTESAVLNINTEGRETFFTESITYIFKLFVSVAILMLACMPILFPLIVDEKFGEAYNLIPIFMAASICNVVVGVYSVIYVALKKTKELAKTSILSGLLNVIVCIAFIKFIGIYAAAVASLISMGAMMIYRCVDLRKYIKVKLPLSDVASLVILFVLNCVVYYSENVIVQITSFIMTCAFLGLLNKSLLSKVFTMAKENKVFQRGCNR